MMGEALAGSQEKGRGSAPKGRRSHTQFGLKREERGNRHRGQVGMGKIV